MLRAIQRLAPNSPDPHRAHLPRRARDSARSIVGARKAAPLTCDEIVKEMIPRVVAERLARFADVFCETDVYTVEESRTILSAGAGGGASSSSCTRTNCVVGRGGASRRARCDVGGPSGRDLGRGDSGARASAPWPRCSRPRWYFWGRTPGAGAGADRGGCAGGPGHGLQPRHLADAAFSAHADASA